MPALIPFRNGVLAAPPAGPSIDELPDRPSSKAKKAELVEWIETVAGRSLDGAADTVPELRSLVDQLIEAVERGDGVGSVSFGDDGVADGVELGEGEPSPVGVLNEDAQSVGHEG